MSSEWTYAVDQVDGAFADYFNNIREEDLQESVKKIADETTRNLLKQDKYFAQALFQYKKVEDFLNTPNHILGPTATKHGEIAEQMEVAIVNAKSLLNGMGYRATIDPNVVGRTVNAPTDYIIDGTSVQSKFINSESNTLNHVLEHLTKYEEIGFARTDGAYYNIPKDQYETIASALKTGSIDGRRLSSSLAIIEKVKRIEQMTGRKFGDVVRASHLKYGEVQIMKAGETLEKLRFEIEKENEQICNKIETEAFFKQKEVFIEYQPSLIEAGKVAGVSAAFGGGLTLVLESYKKIKTGKNFRDFSIDDWKEIGIDTGSASLRGGISGLSVYGLTNLAKMPAPLASCVVSTTIGFCSLAKEYHSGVISSEEFVMQGEALCINTAVATIGGIIGQNLIPVPVLGTLIGSMSATYLLKLSQVHLQGRDYNNIHSLVNTVYSEEYRDAIIKEYLPKLRNEFGEICDLMSLSFDVTINSQMRFSYSQKLASAAGVPQCDILHTREDVDKYFLS